MKKFLVSLVINLVLIFSFSSMVMANEAIEPTQQENQIIITPKASNVFLNYSSSIDYTTSTIICSASNKLTNSTKNSILMELQKYNGSSWQTIKSWNTNGTSLTLSLKESYPKSLGTYRVKSTHQANGESSISYSLQINI
jgi:hypothetical protein